jgi:hypothetical protein
VADATHAYTASKSSVTLDDGSGRLALSGRYRLIPRLATDFGRAPFILSVMGDG